MYLDERLECGLMWTIVKNEGNIESLYVSAHLCTICIASEYLFLILDSLWWVCLLSIAEEYMLESQSLISGLKQQQA